MLMVLCWLYHIISVYKSELLYDDRLFSCDFFTYSRYIYSYGNLFHLLPLMDTKK